MGAKFSTPVQTGPGAHPASYAMGTGSFSGVKRRGGGGGVDHPHIQGGSNISGTDFCVNKPQSVPVIFEPPCNNNIMYPDC